MNIQSISLNKNNNVNFGYWNRTVYKKTICGFQEVVHRNDTSFFRYLKNAQDGDSKNYWDSLIKYIGQKYANTPKVNVYNYACSDGSEPISLLASLKTHFSELFCKKFGIIQARDYDKEAIKRAKSGIYNVYQKEFENIKECTNNKEEDFFNILERNFDYENDYITYKISPKKTLTSQIDFKVADILKDYKNIEKTNSIVSAKNFWPYLEKDIPALVEKLSKQMGENSLLILGDFDQRGCFYHNIDITRLLIKKGFKKTTIDMVFEK